MTNQRKVGVILSYVSELVQIITGLAYTPVMLRLLGQSEYGLYQLVYSVISYLSLFSLGFNSAYMRFYSRFKVTEDEENIRKLNGMFFLIFLIIAIIASICGVVLSLNIKSILGSNLTDVELNKAKLLMIIMTFNLALTFISTVFSSIISSQEQFIFLKAVLIIKEICSPFLTLPLLLLGFGSIGMVSVTTILNILSTITFIIFCFKKLNIKFSFKNLKLGLLKEMWFFTFFIFINQIVDQINWSIDKFLLGRMVGTISVAIYGISSQINTMYLKLSTSISNVFSPKINMLVASKKSDFELTKLMVKVGRIQFIILQLILTGFIIFGNEFIRLWAGQEYATSYYVTLFLIVPVTIPSIQNIGIEIQRAKNKHQIRSVVYLLIAIANIFISIPLIKIFNEIGAAMGTAIGLLTGNVLFINYYYHTKLNLNMFYFWKKILELLKVIIIPGFVGIVLNFLIPLKTGWITLFIKLVIYSVLYLICLIKFGLNEEEKDLLRKPLKRIKVII